MAWSWSLDFRCGDRDLAAAELVSAIETAIGSPPKITLDPMSGNPHDGYQAWTRVEARIGSGEDLVSLSGRLVQRAQQYPGGPVLENTGWVQLSLVGSDVHTLDRVWADLATALGELGYADTTYGEVTAAIVDGLEAAGERDRVSALRQRITAALIARIGEAPPHWGVQIGYSRPHDFNAVIRYGLSRGPLTSLSLTGCGLTELPSVLVNGPDPMDDLQHLDLSFNQLERLPSVAERLPGLRTLNLTGNPISGFKNGDWPGVKVRGSGHGA